ncbi:MAG: hypothetical protein IJ809_02500 [Clostridia bacterium]|nr:hypothetical protein [Clostridia bacterium]
MSNEEKKEFMNFDCKELKRGCFITAGMHIFYRLDDGSIAVDDPKNVVCSYEQEIYLIKFNIGEHNQYVFKADQKIISLYGKNIMDFPNNIEEVYKYRSENDDGIFLKVYDGRYYNILFVTEEELRYILPEYKNFTKVDFEDVYFYAEDDSHMFYIIDVSGNVLRKSSLKLKKVYGYDVFYTKNEVFNDKILFFEDSGVENVEIITTRCDIDLVKVKTADGYIFYDLEDGRYLVGPMLYPNLSLCTKCGNVPDDTAYIFYANKAQMYNVVYILQLKYVHGEKNKIFTKRVFDGAVSIEKSPLIDGIIFKSHLENGSFSIYDKEGELLLKEVHSYSVDKIRQNEYHDLQVLGYDENGNIIQINFLNRFGISKKIRPIKLKYLQSGISKFDGKKEVDVYTSDLLVNPTIAIKGDKGFYLLFKESGRYYNCFCGKEIWIKKARRKNREKEYIYVVSDDEDVMSLYDSTGTRIEL